MGIKLSSLVASLDVQLGEVPETLDLPVQGSLDKVGGSDRAIGDNTSVVAGF
jgi:hypothetical protein